MPKSKYSEGLEGTRFGRTVVKLYVYRRFCIKVYSYYWLCLCDCGTWHITDARSLFRGFTKSCGCKQRGGGTPKHGHARAKGQSREYTSWRKLRGRCDNENNEWFHRYGGRGIRYCSGFKDFQHFLKIAGPRPLGRSIDRINNNGHYSCGSCPECLENQWPMNIRWATPKEQSANTYRSPQYAMASCQEIRDRRD